MTIRLTALADNTGGTLDVNGTPVVTIGGSGITAGYAPLSVTPAALSQKMTLGTAVATTSGTAIDFTSIPSWVKRITVMFSGVSTNGASFKRVQIGTSSGIETTGYLGSSSQNATPATTTGGFDIASNAAADVIHGMITIVSFGSNTWICTLMTGKSDAGTVHTGGFSKTLSGTLDRIRLTTVNGTDTFDAGSVNILYEG